MPEFSSVLFCYKQKEKIQEKGLILKNDNEFNQGS